MRRLNEAWAITWRMVIHGVVLGIATGALYGPVSVLVLYAAEVLNGRYTLTDFPIDSAITYSMVAVVVGIVWGGIAGFFAGTISGVTLTLGLVFRAGDPLRAKLYRNLIVLLSVVGPGVMILLIMTNAILDAGWFFKGQGRGLLPSFLALDILPAVICAVSTWWASMRVVKWWEKAGCGLRQMP